MMGTMQHHAIIVHGDSAFGQVHAARTIAVAIFPHVTPVVPGERNCYESFYVPPDGSKEGWDESDAGDDRRERFYKETAHLRHVEVIEVEWGERELGVRDVRNYYGYDAEEE